MSGNLCDGCGRFFPKVSDECPECGWKRPKHATEPERIARGGQPEVLRKLPLARVGEPQRWRDR